MSWHPEEHFCRRLKIDLLFLSLIATTVIILPVGGDQPSEQPDLISKTCRSTLHYDVCNSTLRSDPQSQSASNLYQLTEIAIGLTITQATQIRSNISSLLGTQALPSYAEQCLKDCDGMYSDAVDSLQQAADDLTQRSFDNLNLRVSAAMTQSTTCEDGFSDGDEQKSPITEDNTYFFVLCSNVLAMNKLLAG